MNIPLLMAHLSKIVYLEKPGEPFDTAKINRELFAFSGGLKIIKTYDRRGTQALLLGHSLYSVLAIRGSNERIDWRNNFTFQLADGRDKIHSGFLNATRAISGEVCADLQDGRIARRPLYLTGHSAGGAIATVLSKMLYDRAIPFERVYTFGQPRVFGTATAKRYDEKLRLKLIRYQNRIDIAHILPPWFFGYRHVGTLRYFDSEGNMHSCIPFLDRLGAFVTNPLSLVNDHSYDDYIRLLER